MPQLNPDPWFFIFTTSWLVYLVLLMSKTSNFKQSNEPTMQNISKSKPQPWNWPWT
uniref:ATP synthase complex subunit 8 n=1 Tax=Hydromantes brunus TaxID=57553 RepID=Q644C2_9SALA|nr:ATP synthase F0 subunit 8 [Hydromantes brunus]AAU20712.1 ATP synthase F0 subunit 8 [Hydromantes brunus]